MSVYRSLPRRDATAPRAPWYRIVRAWLTGTLRKAEARRFRNEVLRDPDDAVLRAKSLDDAFKIAEVLASRHARASTHAAGIAIDRMLKCDDSGMPGDMIFNKLRADVAFVALTRSR